MKRIFFIYLIWYLSYLIISIIGFDYGLWFARLMGLSSFLSFAFISISPLYYLIYHQKGKRSDQSYMNVCLNCGLIRCVIWCFAYYGLADYKIVLTINFFGAFLYVLMESKLKQIDKSYFNL